MKLRLENKGALTVLTVTEDLDEKQLSVLKAGLLKMLRTDTTLIVLDLIGLGEASSEVLKELLEQKKVASQFMAQLFVVSQIPGIGDFRTRDEAFAYILIPTNFLSALDRRMEFRLKSLTAERKDLEKRLSGVRGNTNEINHLRKEHSDLKYLENFLEEEVKKLFLRRQPLDENPQLTAKTEVLDRTLTTALEMEGLLPTN